MVPTGVASRRARGALLVALFACGALLSVPAAARLMDDIEVSAAGDSVRVTIRFTIPVRYLRHFPAAKGEILNVYLQSISGEDLRETLGHPPFDEIRRSPRNSLLPCFTVTYVPPPDPRGAPLQLVFQFKQPENYTVRIGDDSRSLHVTLPAQAEGRPAGGCNGTPKK
jgi:hypothetical protein